MAGLFTNDSNQYGGIKVSVIGYAQVDEALSQLRQIDRDRAVQAGLKAGAAYLVRRGRQRLRKGLKTDAYHRHYQKGNLMKSFVARVKKSKACALAGFKRPEGSHSHLVDEGTGERETASGLRRGKMPEMKYWTDTREKDTHTAQEKVLDGVRKAAIRIMR